MHRLSLRAQARPRLNRGTAVLRRVAIDELALANDFMGMIIFDCDGTLVDSEIIAARVFPKVWATAGVEISEADFLCRIVGTSSEDAYKRALKARLPEGLGAEAERQFHLALRDELRAVRGIEALLDRLPQPLAVCSNSSHAYVVEALRLTNLTRFFGGRVYSGRDVARPKPAPDVFIAAAANSGVDPENCVVVEDSVTGLRAARAAGMKAIALTAGLHCDAVAIERLRSAEPDHLCTSIEDLTHLLLNDLKTVTGA